MVGWTPAPPGGLVPCPRQAGLLALPAGVAALGAAGTCMRMASHPACVHPSAASFLPGPTRWITSRPTAASLSAATVATGRPWASSCTLKCCWPGRSTRWGGRRGVFKHGTKHSDGRAVVQATAVTPRCLAARLFALICCHPPSAVLPLPPLVQAQLAEFMRWALAQEGVWAVTISELLRWMKDPVPASKYELQCGPPAAGAAPRDVRGGAAAAAPGHDVS